MTDARFPPPGGQAGYREPSQPSIDVEAAAPPPHKKVVIATRPHDPDMDDAKPPPRSVRDAVTERRWLVATMLVLAILVTSAIVKVIVWPANSRGTSNSHKAR